MEDGFMSGEKHAGLQMFDVLVDSREHMSVTQQRIKRE